MRRVVCITAVLFCVPCTSPAAPSAGPVPENEIHEIEDHLLKERSRIEKAQMTIELEIYQNGSSGTMNRKSKLSVWCSGNKVRIDERIAPAKSPSGAEIPDHTEVTCRGCYSADTIFEYSDLPSSGGPSRAATITDVSLWKRPEIPNPLLLGFTPKGYFRTGGIASDAYIGCRNRDHVAVSRVKYNEANCWKVAFEKRNPRFTSNVVYFVSEDEGNSIVHIEETAEPGDLRFVDTVDCRNQKLGDGGPWFPEELVFERRKNGEVINRESLKIEVTAINDKTIDESFSLPAIPILKAGTHVSRQSADPDPAFRDGNGVWMRNRISPTGASIDEPAEHVDPVTGSATRRRSLLAASSVCLLVLLAIVLWKRR